jgi:hypothetical protein
MTKPESSATLGDPAVTSRRFVSPQPNPRSGPEGCTSTPRWGVTTTGANRELTGLLVCRCDIQPLLSDTVGV